MLALSPLMEDSTRGRAELLICAVIAAGFDVAPLADVPTNRMMHSCTAVHSTLPAISSCKHMHEYYNSLAYLILSDVLAHKQCHVMLQADVALATLPTPLTQRVHLEFVVSDLCSKQKSSLWIRIYGWPGC